jgi:hypothetical protein
MTEPLDHDGDGRLSRRSLLAAAAAAAWPGLADAAPGRSRLPARYHPASAVGPKPGIPGPFRGRVVEVQHPGSVAAGKVDREAVAAMVTRGMVALTGAADAAAAWKRFFGPADVVGIKISPVGRPLSVSQPETILAVIQGLNLAGVPNRNILLINRYEQEILDGGFDQNLPAGVRIGYGARKFDAIQNGLEGYDPDVYVEMGRELPGQDPAKPVNRRSHLCRVVSRDLTKIVNIAALKDHASAGVTMALKNLSHGLVNNVSRSHPSGAVNWCDTFIPTVVGMVPIRRKTVLQIGDGLIGTYDGGPGTWNDHFRTWEYRALFFATDPVALDRIGWKILDAKRVAAGLPTLARTGRNGQNPGHESFDHRQPEHVLLAGAAGLGESNLAAIKHRVVRMG